VPADAGDDMVLDGERSHRAKVHLVEIADRLVPALFAVLQIKGDNITVGGLEVEPVAIDRHAAAAAVDAAFRLPRKVAYLAACARVDGPGVVRQAEVKNAINLNGRGLDCASESAARVHAVDPGETERTDIRIVDLVERAETATRIVAVVHWPGVRGKLHQL